MRSFGILLLCCATAVLAASTRYDDQKKDKRHLQLGNHGVSTYSLPYGLARYPTGLQDTKVLGAGVPLDNSLGLVYPSGWKYGDLLYKGNAIGLNELGLFAQPGGLVNALSPILARDEISGRIIIVQVPPPDGSRRIPVLQLIADLAVQGGIESLLQNFQFN